MHGIQRVATTATAPKPSPRPSSCIIPMADADEERAWDDEMRRRGMLKAA